ncbi:hypothetical protein H2O64_16330 [Kordia sp. YSTF-M3]|uniref:Tetratricopeptide repeat protein n=1 Tax=Kordia aestuariivivens TaxID=2759037 RepID=A0ABR7QD35_9FLAO|nr:hypothetical protein [Kordia aestuariivivens]MBC8756244.1 hypothetical protein [Kordia aestuariivivens]
MKTPIHKILIAISLLITATSCDVTSAEDYYDDATELSANFKWEEAILLLDKAIEKKPTFRLALIQRGFGKALWLEDYEGGIEDFKKVLTIDPDNTLALYYIGLTYDDQQQYVKGIEYLSKALLTEGVQKTISIEENLKLDGDYDKESLFTVDVSNIYYERGLAYVRTEKYDKAIVDLRKVVTAGAYLRDSYFLLGEAYLGKKDTINACQNFSESAKLGDEEASKMLTKYCNKTNE